MVYDQNYFNCSTLYYTKMCFKILKIFRRNSSQSFSQAIYFSHSSSKGGLTFIASLQLLQKAPFKKKTVCPKFLKNSRQ
jgi:hypothetical protein